MISIFRQYFRKISQNDEPWWSPGWSFAKTVPPSVFDAPRVLRAKTGELNGLKCLFLYYYLLDSLVQKQLTTTSDPEPTKSICNNNAHFTDLSLKINRRWFSTNFKYIMYIRKIESRFSDSHRYKVYWFFRVKFSRWLCPRLHRISSVLFHKFQN